MLDTVFILTAYLIGSLSFAVIVSRVMGLPDPHEYGSGNPGATNVLRTGNKLAALLTLLGDALKGWLAVWLALRLQWRFDLSDTTVALVGLAVFLGHLYPVFFKFQGGKGVATAAGILFAYDWRIGLGTVATWIIIAAFFRYSSLAALIAAVFAPFFAGLVLGFDVYAVSTFFIAALLIWRHRENIRKLREGKESRIGGPKPVGATAPQSAPSDPSADGP